MAAEQDGGMATGRVPGLNTERVYTRTVSADELARALADHFHAQGFEAQVFRTRRGVGCRAWRRHDLTAGLGGPVGADEEVGEVGGLVADEAGGMRPFTGDPRRAEDGGATASRSTAAPASGER